MQQFWSVSLVTATLQVQHLELTMKETHGEMDDRMRRLDNTLHNYEAEVKERTGQVGERTC